MGWRHGHCVPACGVVTIGTSVEEDSLLLTVLTCSVLLLEISDGRLVGFAPQICLQRSVHPRIGTCRSRPPKYPQSNRSRIWRQENNKLKQGTGIPLCGSEANVASLATGSCPSASGRFVLRNLGYDVHWQTVRRVMKDHGLLDDPDPEPKTSWKTFLASHWESIAATDFFTVEAWTKTGLSRFLVLFVIDISTRRVQIAGIHRNPTEKQMLQWARNLTDAEDGFLKGKRVLIHDRDPLFTSRFRQTLHAAGVRCLKTHKQSPNLNGYCSSCTLLAA